MRMKKVVGVASLVVAVVTFITAVLIVCPLLLRPADTSALAAESSVLDEINGICGSSFEKDQYLTREEFCVVIAKVFIKTQTESALPFVDLDEISPDSVGYLASLYEYNLLAGSLVDGRLYMLPDSMITRQEAITLLGRLINGTSDGAILGFSDVDKIAPYAYKFISWFVERELIIGLPDGTIGPENVMTAEELAYLVSRTLEYRQSRVISYMGTGMRGHADGNIEIARFNLPHGLTVDKNGNLTVFDTYNNMIRVIKGNQTDTLLGKIVQYDDNGHPQGYFVDGKLEGALVSRPTDGVYGGGGELFFTDSANHVIKIISDDLLYTFTGRNLPGYADGDQQTAMFNYPTAIAIDDNNNLYVADTLNHCIRKVDGAGNVTTIAGTPKKGGYSDGAAGTATFLDPAGIAVSADGKTVYVADTGNNLIRKIENGSVTTVAGAMSDKDSDGYPEGGFRDGAAGQALFNQPKGIALSNGSLYIADSGNHMIRMLDKAGVVKTICGGGEPGDEEDDLFGAVLNGAADVLVYKGDLYIADTLNNKVKVVILDTDVN